MEIDSIDLANAMNISYRDDDKRKRIEEIAHLKIKYEEKLEVM